MSVRVVVISAIDVGGPVDLDGTCCGPTKPETLFSSTSPFARSTTHVPSDSEVLEIFRRAMLGHTSLWFSFTPSCFPALEEYCCRCARSLFGAFLVPYTRSSLCGFDSFTLFSAAVGFPVSEYNIFWAPTLRSLVLRFFQDDCPQLPAACAHVMELNKRCLSDPVAGVFVTRQWAYCRDAHASFFHIGH